MCALGWQRRVTMDSEGKLRRVGQPPQQGSKELGPGCTSLSHLAPCRAPFAHMSSSPSLADQLVTACWDGDLQSAEAALADGASVSEKGRAHAGFCGLPLEAAVARQRHDVVVWLLSLGADPEGYRVMYYGARFSTAGILLLLIDAGGDVNRETYVLPPLFAAVWGNNWEDNVRVLLAQPSLDFTIKYDGYTPEQYARDKGWPEVADMIAQEVRRTFPFCSGSDAGADVVSVALLWLADRETSDAGTTSVLFVGS